MAPILHSVEDANNFDSVIFPALIKDNPLIEWRRENPETNTFQTLISEVRLRASIGKTCKELEGSKCGIEKSARGFGIIFIDISGAQGEVVINLRT